MICKEAVQQVEVHTLITTHGERAVGLQLTRTGEDHLEFLEKAPAPAVLCSVVAIFAHTVCSVAKPTLAVVMPVEALTGICYAV
jgi:hypothetical protein